MTIYIYSKRFMLPLLHHSLLIIHISHIAILIILCYNINVMAILLRLKICCLVSKDHYYV